MQTILILGGAGFVGTQLASRLRVEYPKSKILAADNLKRRGSEINIKLLKEKNISFSHVDIRIPTDLIDLEGCFDLVIDCSAEPSVLAGLEGTPNYVLQTNLIGTLNALEFTRLRGKKFLFLSTSRVYSIQPLRELQFTETDSRFSLNPQQKTTGISSKGVAENFPTNLPRSLYGASKLCSENIIQEYVDTYRIEALINRCGVIAGPGQFGKTDQGVFTLWVANHLFNQNLKYTGFGGAGKQVRDLLHPEDLYDLISKQIMDKQIWRGEIFNVGGGAEGSVSLKELTSLCQKSTGNQVQINSESTSATVDIPWFITDTSKVAQKYDWHCKHSPQSIVSEITNWLRLNEKELKPLFA